MPRGEWASWAQFAGAILGIGAAILAPLVVLYLERLRTRRGYFELVALDVKLAAGLASTYLHSDVKAPAYRLSLHGAQTALPFLLADGRLSMAEASLLAKFYVDAESFNRCLDLTAALKQEGKDWQAEVSRNTIKAAMLVPKVVQRKYPKLERRPSRYDGAMEVLRFHLPKESLERLEFEPSPYDEDLEGL